MALAYALARRAVRCRGRRLFLQQGAIAEARLRTQTLSHGSRANLPEGRHVACLSLPFQWKHAMFCDSLTTQTCRWSPDAYENLFRSFTASAFLLSGLVTAFCEPERDSDASCPLNCAETSHATQNSWSPGLWLCNRALNKFRAVTCSQ